MAAEYTNRVLETILTAKKYKNREDAIATAEAIVNAACDLGDMSPSWIQSYKDALCFIKNLSFKDMKYVIDVVDFYKDKSKQQSSDDSEEEYGEEEYNKGVEFYRQEDYLNASANFRAASYMGNAKAEYNYGLCLYNGQGVCEDKAEAIKHFVYAADAGVRKADKMLYFIAYGKYNDSSCF